jgi:hypothetical protein
MTLTLNLSNYTGEDLLLDFCFMHHGKEINANDKYGRGAARLIHGLRSMISSLHHLFPVYYG